MENSLLFPPVKQRPISPNPTSAAVNGGAAPFKRTKPSQPPLYVLPGHVAFRLLCHVSRIGGLIGKSGSIIKHLQQLTNSKIRVEDPDPEYSGDHRVVAVISPLNITNKIKLSDEEEWYDVSAAQEGLVRVFERVVEVAADGGDSAAEIGGVVSCSLLVWKNQAGAIIGRGGKVVEMIKMNSGTRINVLSSDKFSSSSSDEIVEIEGSVLAVKKALIAITSRLQEFPAMDLPVHRGPIHQPIPSNYTNHASGHNFSSLEPEKVLDSSRTQEKQEVVFKMLCPNERVGGIIGKEGSIHKAIQNETGAFIIIGPTIADCQERLITITAMESVKSQQSPAQNAAVCVFNRMEAHDVKGLDSSPIITAQVVVSSNQVGCILGKGGSIISEMRKATGAFLRIVSGNQVPNCASENDEVLQITGEFSSVQDALYKVTSRLRDNTFYTKTSIGNGNRNSIRKENSTYGRAKDYPYLGSHSSNGTSNNLNEHKSLTQSMNRLGISNNIDQPMSPSLSALPTISKSHHENFMDNSRRSPAVKGVVELGRSAIVTNTIVEIIVPDSIINYSNLASMRQISGAKVIVNEPSRPGTNERTMVISGTPDETQAAQSLLQAFLLAG